MVIFRERTQAGNGHDCFQSRSPWTAPLKEGATIHHLKVVCCALPGASCGKRMIARSVPASVNHHRGSYTSPTLPCGSYPFVNLREANTLLRKLFTSRKSEKNVRQHSGTQKGAIEAITSIHTGYMIRAPTFRRSTQRQEPHPLQLNTAAPQDLRSAGTAAFTRGRFFYAAATIR